MTSGLSGTSGSPKPTLNETVSVLRCAVAVCPHHLPLRSSLAELCCILKPSEVGDICDLDSPTTWQSSLTEIHDLAVNVLKKSSLNLPTFLEIHDGNDVPHTCNSSSDFNNLNTMARQLRTSLDARGFITAFCPKQHDHYVLHDLASRISTEAMSKAALFEKLREVFSAVPKILGFLEILAAKVPISLRSIQEALISAAKLSGSVLPSTQEAFPAPDVSQLTIAANAALKLHNLLATVNGKAGVDCCEFLRRLIDHIFHDALPLDSSSRESALKLTSSVDPDDMLAGLTSGAPCCLPGTHTVSIDGHKLFSTGVTVVFFRTPMPSPSVRLTFRNSMLALRTIGHPCIQTVYGAHWPHNPGTRAHVVIERRIARLSDARAISLLDEKSRMSVLRDISAAIAHIHKHCLYHGAISPDVICLRFEDQTLCGRAKLDVTAICIRAIVLRNYHLAGTFAPPEIIRGETNVHIAADVWSFGMLVAYLHHDNPSRFEDSMTAVSAAHSHQVPSFVEELLSGVRNPSWLSIARDCLKVDARKRLSIATLSDTVERLVCNRGDIIMRDTVPGKQISDRAGQQGNDDETYIEEEILDSGTGHSLGILHRTAAWSSSGLNRNNNLNGTTRSAASPPRKPHIPRSTADGITKSTTENDCSSIPVPSQVQDQKTCSNGEAQTIVDTPIPITGRKRQRYQTSLEPSQSAELSSIKGHPSDSCTGTVLQNTQTSSLEAPASAGATPRKPLPERQGATKVSPQMKAQVGRSESFLNSQPMIVSPPERPPSSRVQFSSTKGSLNGNEIGFCNQSAKSRSDIAVPQKPVFEHSNGLGKSPFCASFSSSFHPTTRFRYSVCVPPPPPLDTAERSAQPKSGAARAARADKPSLLPSHGNDLVSSFSSVGHQETSTISEVNFSLTNHSARSQVPADSKLVAPASLGSNKHPLNAPSFETLSHDAMGLQKPLSNTPSSAPRELVSKDLVCSAEPVVQNPSSNLTPNISEKVRPSQKLTLLMPPSEIPASPDPVASVEAILPISSTPTTRGNSQPGYNTIRIEHPTVVPPKVACTNTQAKSSESTSTADPSPMHTPTAVSEPKVSIPLSQDLATFGGSKPQVLTEGTPVFVLKSTPPAPIPGHNDMPSKNLVTNVDNSKDNVACAGLKNGETNNTSPTQRIHDTSFSPCNAGLIQHSHESVLQIHEPHGETPQSKSEVAKNPFLETCASGLGDDRPSCRKPPLPPCNIQASPVSVDRSNALPRDVKRTGVASSSEIQDEKHGVALVPTEKQSKSGTSKVLTQANTGVTGNSCDVEGNDKQPLSEPQDISNKSTLVISTEGGGILGSKAQTARKSQDNSEEVNLVHPTSGSCETERVLPAGHQSRSGGVQVEVINLDDDSSEDNSEICITPPRNRLGRLMKRVEAVSPNSENGDDTIVMASQQKTGLVVSDEARSWNKEGEMRLTGRGVPVNFPLAVTLFRRAAEKNCPEAHYNLACCYEFERGLERNEDQVNHHYKQAALLGHVRAQVKLAELHEKSDTWTDKEVAFYWYNKAMDRSSEAMFKVGEAYERGNGVRKNEEKAASFYERAAEQGNSDGMLSLGNLLRSGRGVTTDHRRALELYQKSAEKGNPRALLKLGKWYKDGELVKDINKALDCLIRASRLAWDGKGEACFEAGHCYELKSGGEQDLDRAENFYREAYSLHSGDAAYRLGLLAWKRKEWSQAADWWKLAADAGTNLALVKLGICAEEGRGMRKSSSEAFKYYKKAMKHNCIEAFSRAGLLYEKGHMSKKNVSSAKHKSEAAKYYETGVERGCITSMGLLGQCYLTAFGKNQDIQRGLSLFRTAASKGDRLSMTELGDCYRDGIGVECDLKEACSFYKMAANLGYAEAEVRYAECLYYGYGTPKDTQRAIIFAERAIAQDYAEGHRVKGDILLDGRGIQKDVASALYHYRKAAQFKDPSAMVTLGKLYESGNEGVVKDLSKAFALYKRAADQKCNVAMNNLGVMYERGIFVRQCYSKAVEWYEKGRACGGTEATCNLADCYMQGNGVVKDFEMAFRLYRDAAEGGDHTAMTELGTCFSEGIGVDKDIKRGVGLYEEAHTAGDTEATRRLGVALLDGVGVERNVSRGMALLDEAIEKENIDALLDKGRFYYIGRGVQKDISEALKLFHASAKNGNITATKYLGNILFDGDSDSGVDREQAFKLYSRSLEDIYDQCERHESEQPCPPTQD